MHEPSQAHTDDQLSTDPPDLAGMVAQMANNGRKNRVKADSQALVPVQCSPAWVSRLQADDSRSAHIQYVTALLAL